MQNPSLPAVVHNWLEDTKNSMVVDVVAPRLMGSAEMETYAARALQRLKKEGLPRPGKVLTVMILNGNDALNELGEYGSNWTH
jgi:hypothetical protein